MRKVNISTKNMSRFAGKWVVIDPLITRPVSDKRPSGTMPAAFKVPRKDEGPYVLISL